MSRKILLLALVAMAASHSATLCGDEPEAKVSDPTRVVYLNAGRDFAIRFGKNNYQGLLARELTRQALLIAAREELSCVTRDVHLGQSMPTTGGVELDLVGVAGKTSRLELLAGKPPTQEVLATEDLQPGDDIDLAALVPRLESLSRDAFVKHLRTAGLKGEPRPWSDDAKVSAEVSKLLLELNFVSQFDAACRLHGEIAQRGQSPAVLAALSMAYANLGLLTELHWAPAHDVFTARALLYAQRLVASEKNPARGLSAHAYAHTLAGLFPAALADLDAFAKLSPPKKAGDKLPLADLLRAYCRFSLKELEPENYKPSLVELATLLRFLVHDFTQTNDQRAEVGVEAMNKIPHCYRIVTALSTSPGVNLGHVTTASAPIMTAATLYPRVAEIEGLPNGAQAIIKKLALRPTATGEVAFDPGEDYAGRAKLVALLAKSHEPIYGQRELTWPVLASQITEHSFTEIFLRARFCKVHWGVPADDWLDYTLPMYEGHPYAPLVETFRSTPHLVETAIQKAMQIDFDVSELQSFTLAKIESTDPQWMQRLNFFKVIHLSHMDGTVNDLSRIIFLHPKIPFVAATLFQLCPDQPVGQKAMVENNWAEIQKNPDEWLKRGDKNPEVLIAFGKRYVFEFKFDKAVELMKRACEIQPSFDRLNELAKVYELQKNRVEWQATLEKSLKYPNYGLEQYFVQREIAIYLGSQRKWKEALPFAEGAAECYSEWGLMIAGACHEALQNWGEAEKYFQAASERYGRIWWYSFTRRTGQGNLAAAAATARAQMTTASPNRRQDDELPFYYLLFVKNTPAAAEYLQATWAKHPNVLSFALHYALLLDEQKKPREAVAVLKQALQLDLQPGQQAVRDPLARELAQLIEADLAGAGKADFPPGAMEKLRGRLKPEDYSAPFDYFLGRYYELHGKKDDARRSYIACMSYPTEMLDTNRTLAGIGLVAMGEKPSVYREALHTGKIPEKNGK